MVAKLSKANTERDRICKRSHPLKDSGIFFEFFEFLHQHSKLKVSPQNTKYLFFFFQCVTNFWNHSAQLNQMHANFLTQRSLCFAQNMLLGYVRKTIITVHSFILTLFQLWTNIHSQHSQCSILSRRVATTFRSHWFILMQWNFGHVSFCLLWSLSEQNFFWFARNST